jgi:hypothetical protein
MRFTVVRSILLMTVSALGLLSVASCSPDAPVSTASNGQISNPVDPPRVAVAYLERSPTLIGPGSAPIVDEPPVAPPKDAQWTLLVFSEQGPTHVSDANALKKTLIAKTNRRDWYVIHSGDESDIYFGYYRAFDEPLDPATKTAQADLQMVKDIELLDTDGQAETPFKRAAFVSIASPDPAAPPEWNLFNKDLDKTPKDPTRAYWSLQIMAFRADPLRKEAAVQAVAALRKNGVEAYYYHGDTVSSVCIGAWPMDAVEHQNHDGDHTVADETKTLVVPGQGVPVGDIPKYDDEGHRMVQVAPVVNVLDSSLKACMKKFPSHAVNYEIGRKKGTDGNLYEDPSFLVVIPRARGNGFYDSADVTPADLASGLDNETRGHVGFIPTSARQSPDSLGNIGTDPAPPAAAPGKGHLRHLGEN